jgi:quercetin dioxygenase-like cupin family protein
LFGTWRSLVAHTLGVRGVGGSNPPVPTIFFTMDDIKKQDSGEDLLARSLALAGLVQYQAGAVVSRTIINRKTGTVTLFAFDQGQELSEHTAPFDAMAVILDGQAEVAIAGRSQAVHNGEMIIMPAHKPHALKAASRFKMLLIMIRT